jgi:hypothetical protein
LEESGLEISGYRRFLLASTKKNRRTGVPKMTEGYG